MHFGIRRIPETFSSSRPNRISSQIVDNRNRFAHTPRILIHLTHDHYLCVQFRLSFEDCARIHVTDPRRDVSPYIIRSRSISSIQAEILYASCARKRS